MIRLDSLICHGCRDESNVTLFDNENCRPIRGTCGHSICEVCVEADPKVKCPTCYKREAFLNQPVNYAALDIPKEYEKHIFEKVKEWWQGYLDTTTTEDQIYEYGHSDLGREVRYPGYCADCFQKDNLKLCLTCKDTKPYKGMHILSYAVCDSCAVAEYGDKKLERYRDHMEPTSEKSECHLCHKKTTDLKFDGSLLERRSDYPFEKYCFCANCALDNHEGHQVVMTIHLHLSKEWRSVRDTAAEIMRKLLKKKLYVDEEQVKCRLRYKRMMLTMDELIKLLKNPYYQYRNREGTIEKTLSSLVTQYDQFQKLDSVCKCVGLWNDVVRLNIFDFKERSPHFHSMADKAHLEKKFDVCPYQLPTSGPEKRSLLKLIEKGKPLTQPFKMDIFKEVRRGRFRNVYCFPAKRNEKSNIYSEDKEFSQHLAEGREQSESFLKHIKTLPSSVYNDPGHLIYPDAADSWRFEEHTPWNLRGTE
ncbi:hypothetical protein GCK72_007078 [Caenorhabditis remanei]|uniref:RING-type domain-containing protein n=1 Tax=Caenorhabditis remanei TaxID=31234 RepID=A0A6A5HGI2_CAERE|nr:hypothetical protein GCK72_007078 [Caenorhabditis remanei]KAF1767120.1 hypothetical protein GCK72_007078 [Caenorhabditis remanei]